jgi:hypothetical protein
MPKTVPCPTCRSDVKVPRDVEPGTELTCPGCAEVFVPKHLSMRDDDPDDDDAPYDVRSAAADPDREAKKQKARAIMRQGRQTERERKRPAPKPIIGGAEMVLLFMAAAMAVGVVIAYVAMKRVPSIGEAILIILVYGGLLAFFGWRKRIEGRQRLGG